MCSISNSNWTRSIRQGADPSVDDEHVTAPDQGMGRSACGAEPSPGVVARTSAVVCLPCGRRTHRRSKGRDRDCRRPMREVANAALPRRRRPACGRHVVGFAGRSASPAVASRMAKHSGRFPRSSGQCTSAAAGLIDARLIPRRRHASLVGRLMSRLRDFLLA